MYLRTVVALPTARAGVVKEISETPEAGPRERKCFCFLLSFSPLKLTVNSLVVGTTLLLSGDLLEGSELVLGMRRGSLREAGDRL